MHYPPTSAPELYEQNGLGPLPADASGKDLFLDAVKRTLMNIHYECAPNFFFNAGKTHEVAKKFSLDRRVNGEDKPDLAHTMIGLRRLDNLQHCIESVIEEDIPGDIVETGVLRGGASIFARAVLKAHNVTDRCVFACDAFKAPPLLPVVVAWPLQMLARIPIKWWQLLLLRYVQKFDKYKQFPDDFVMEDEWAPFFIWILQNLMIMRSCKGANEEIVRSYFARYGLWDNQVKLLEGFFAETLPNAPIERVAVLRLDGDLYDSTIDALEPLYPKLSAGGYCIVDDYESFYGCKRAIHDYRDKHNINDEIIPIDNQSVYWRKSN